MDPIEEILSIENVLEALRLKRVREADTPLIAAQTDEVHSQADARRRLLIAALSPAQDMRLEILREANKEGWAETAMTHKPSPK